MAEIRLGYFTILKGWGGAEMYMDQLVREATQVYSNVTVFCRAQYPYTRAGADRVMPPEGCKLVNFDGNIKHSARLSKGSSLSLTAWMWQRLVPLRVREAIRIYQIRSVYKETRYYRRLFRKHPVDLMHFNSIGSCEAAVIAAKLERIPVIIGTYHSLTYEYDQALISRIIRRLCTRCFTKAIAVSRAVKQNWLGEDAHLAEKMRVIYNGVDISAFDDKGNTDSLKRELGLKSDAPIVGVTARLGPEKGHTYLIEAACIVKKNIPNVVFILAGDGSQREQLERYVRKMNLAANFKFLGFRKDIIPITHIYDVSVLPSKYESLPYALIEAMACSKPVIGTRVGGVPEIIENAKTGYVVEPRSPVTLADAITGLLTNQEKARQMGTAGRQRVERLFQQDRMVKETLTLYDQLLSMLEKTNP